MPIPRLAHVVLVNYERPTAVGITPYWPVHHGFSLSMYYQDPDGNRHNENFAL